MSNDRKPRPLVHPNAGSEPNIHSTPAETRERTYDRARQGGLSHDAAKETAEQVGRDLHNHLNRRGR